jgi:hypothetical protein
MPFTNIPSLLSEALEARGYTALTPVQAHVIEDNAIGRDLIVSAQTGSGKTVAFGLAMAGELLGEAVAEVEAFELAQRALTIAADRGGFADRVELGLGRHATADWPRCGSERTGGAAARVPLALGRSRAPRRPRAPRAR